MFRMSSRSAGLLVSWLTNPNIASGILSAAMLSLSIVSPSPKGYRESTPTSPGSTSSSGREASRPPARARGCRSGAAYFQALKIV